MNFTKAVDQPYSHSLQDEQFAPESLLSPMELTTADRGRRRGYNNNHWLDEGMARLTIRSKNNEQHYCLKCAKALLTEGTEHSRYSSME